MVTSYKVFAGVSPGLEHFLTAELRRIAPVKWRTMSGGAEARMPAEDLWKVCRSSRLAELVRVRIGEVRATTFYEFVEGVEKLPWAAYLNRPSPRPRVVSSTFRSKLWHTDAISERVLVGLANRGVMRYMDLPTEAKQYVQGGRALQDKHKGFAFAPTAVPASIFVRFDRDDAVISVDASGPDLYKRGYRAAIGKSPLRETLAAACLHVIQDDLNLPEDVPLLQGRNLWDPMCGSGTLILEAAAEAVGLLPGHGRNYAFESWPTHDPEAYKSLVELPMLEQGHANPQAGKALQAREQVPGPLRITKVAIGSDICGQAIRSAVANVRVLGVKGPCMFKRSSMMAMSQNVPRGSVLATNVPYGVRLGDVKKAVADLNELLLKRTDLVGYAVCRRGTLEGNNVGAKRWAPIAEFENGGIPVALCKLTPHKGIRYVDGPSGAKLAKAAADRLPKPEGQGGGGGGGRPCAFRNDGSELSCL